MGCDIHMRAEKRINGTWTAIGREFVSCRYDHENDHFKQDRYKRCSEPFDGRSYDTFAILADVRNGSGFAGCVTGSGFNFISEPRGLPEDIAEHIDDEPWDSNDPAFWFGDHSHSWLTLAELVGFDWTQETHKSGWVNGPTRAKLLAGGDKWPDGWCGGVSGPNVQHVSLSELDHRLKEGEDCQSVYAEYAWPVTYKEAAKFFYEKTIPALQKIASDAGLKDEDVRIVFGFDS